MATKNFRSTVLEPTSEFSYGDKLRFTALSSINQVFKRSFSEVTIGTDGVYDIDLQYGKYRIDYKPYEGIWALFANVEVGAETTATTLQDLAMTSSPVTDDTILALQAILAETKANAENAEKSSSDSVAAAAEAAQDRAEIEDLMLRAMTTADVEAIRASNKALYAASGVDTWGTVGSEPVNPKRGGLNCIDESNTFLIDGKYHIAGLTFEIPTDSKVAFPEAPDGTVTYNKSTGVVTQHATFTEAFAAADADTNVEVVINRVDLNCLEYYLRAVTESDPFVYPNGDIHSQATAMAGVTTTLDNVRPDSYFANFTGQTDVIRGNGVNWFTATNAEKLKILSESNEHGCLHYDTAASEWRQWCLRKVTIAGAGNGDWYNIDAATSTMSLEYLSTKLFVQPQGAHDTRKEMGHYSYAYGHFLAYSIGLTRLNKGTVGSFIAVGPTGHAIVSSSIAIDGECYLYVVSTHPRINKAAYHLSHNGMGGQKFSGALAWYQTTLGTSLQTTAANSDTAIASGRPDDKLYNKIYPSGQGGTIDHRMTAYETGTAEVRESVLNEVYAGTYRGVQSLEFTKAVQVIAGQLVKRSAYYFSAPKSIFDYSASVSKIHLVYTDGSVYTFDVVVVSTRSDAEFDIKTAQPILHDLSLASKILFSRRVGVSISGDFINADVAASVDKILTNPDLKNGWFGGWITADYSDASLRYADLAFTRKAASASGLKFKDSAWTAFSVTPDYSANTVSSDSAGLYDNDAVILMNYTAFAKQTKVSTKKPILNGSNGKGEVWSNSSRENAAFSESLIGKVITGAQGNARHAVLETSISADSKFDAINPTIHAEISLPAPANNSPAVKVLPYQAATNQQTAICFAATELKYTNANWGDDSKIHFVDGVSTLMDTNGETVLCATHELSMPIGHTKKVN